MGRTERSERSGTITSVLAQRGRCAVRSKPGFRRRRRRPRICSSSSITWPPVRAGDHRGARIVPTSRQSLRKILESQPDSLQALFQLGSIRVAEQAADRSRATIARLRRIDPNDARAAGSSAAMALGQTDEVALAEARRLAAAGAYDRAIAMYQRAFRGGRYNAGSTWPWSITRRWRERARAGTATRIRLKVLAERDITTSEPSSPIPRPHIQRAGARGIVLLAELASDPAVAQASLEAMRPGACCGSRSGRRTAC